MYKKVKVIIQVPVGEFCFGNAGYRTCPHFNNSDGAAPGCGIKSIIDWPDLAYDEEGRVPKPEQCKELVIVVGRT